MIASHAPVSSCNVNCMTTQLAVRVPDTTAAEIDALVADEQYLNRTEIVRTAIDEFLDRVRRQRIGQQIVAGYQRIPPTDEFDTLHETANRELLQSLEPWSWDE